MDTNALVEGGSVGLQEVVYALEADGVHIDGAYLIGMTADAGDQSTYLRVVTPDDPRSVLYKLVDLRRAGKLPTISGEVAFSPIARNHVEASRVLDYARRAGRSPVLIRGVLWRGLYIEDAVVVKWPADEHATI